MKKISLILTGIVSFNLGFAQTARLVDLKIRLLYPIADQIITSPSVVNLKFSVYNKGKDSIKPSDKMLLHTCGMDSGTRKYKYIYPNIFIAPNDSAVFTEPLPTYYEYNWDYYQIGICFCMFVNKGSDSLRDESLDQQKDNKNIVMVKHRFTNKIIDNTKNPNIIYPNPSSGLFSIKQDYTVPGSQIKVYDVQGRLVLDENVLNNTSNYDIDLSHLPSGVYSFNYKTPNNNFSGKIVKTPCAK